MTDEEADSEALSIYVVMAREPIDAIDIINECENVRVLETLHTMLTTRTDRPHTDHELNALMAGPVKRRLDEVKAKTP